MIHCTLEDCFFLWLFSNWNIAALALSSTNDPNFEPSQLSPDYHRYQLGDFGDYGARSTPSWIITDCNVSAIHRFFDSSPFSPSGRYLALLQISGGENVRNIEGEFAQVIVYDLKLGPSAKKVIASTAAWDSQVGSHVQWGATDHDLLFNTFKVDSKSVIPVEGKNSQRFAPRKKMDGMLLRGVVHDIFTGESRHLDCPIYHVSQGGNYALSPDLLKIQFTQLGYGVRSASARANSNAPHNDGIRLINLSTGKCTLLKSLQELAIAGNLDTKATSTYGFHTKFSTDGKMIMFVLRTLEKRNSPLGLSAFFSGSSGLFGSKMKRTQHLFVMKLDGSHPLLLLSWGSGILNDGSNAVLPGPVDGNHPNWVFNSHNISINLAAEETGGGEGAEGASRRGSSRTFLKSPLKWEVVTMDVDSIMRATSSPTAQSSEKYKRNSSSYLTSVYPYGSGHPTVLTGGRYVLMDAYPKERAGLLTLNPNGLEGGMLRPGHVPLRLADTLAKKEVWLLQIQTERSEDLHATQGHGKRKASKEKNAWRCDPHPVLSRDAQWVAFNGRPAGGNRQVLIAYLGTEKRIEKLFSL